MTEADETYWNNKRDMLAASYSSGHYTAEQKRLDIALHYMRKQGCQSLIDIGCGTGETLLRATEAGIDKLSGCDLSTEMVDTTAERLLSDGKTGNLFVWDLGTVFSHAIAHTHDALTCFSVLPYVPNWRNFFAALPKLVKPGGLVMLSFPNRLFDLYTLNDFTADFIQSQLMARELHTSKAITEFLGHTPAFKDSSAYAGNVNFTRVTPIEIEAQMAEYGLKAVRTHYMNYHPVPPRFEADFDAAELEQLKQAKEKDILASNWSDMFTHSTFLTVFKYEPDSNTAGVG